ncbi:ATP synthase subunit I [Candidatus Atribacteria bacterium 1244-E10-H5-B2]|nr:MAG: ATP synthase subunit I [Candidatus Atribacteria bacterium 1244-E10-H5-B2]
MNINIYSLLYLLVGLGLGLFYFGGLWLTIKNMNQARSPIVLTLGSFILRTGAVFLVLIYVARQGDWENILILLAGFIVSRIFLSRMIGKRKKG